MLNSQCREMLDQAIAKLRDDMPDSLFWERHAAAQFGNQVLRVSGASTDIEYQRYKQRIDAAVMHRQATKTRSGRMAQS